jgi:hypothetical protein
MSHYISGRVLGAILAVTGLTLDGGNAQKPLLNRAGALDPEHQSIYDSPEYNDAYVRAEINYSDTKPDTSMLATWDQQKRPLWAANMEYQLQKYSEDFRAFKHRLELASEASQNRSDPSKIAQISVIQNRLSAETMYTLNALVISVNLGKLFIDDRQPEMAKLWVPWPPQPTVHVLNNYRMAEVLQFVEAIDTCLTRSQGDQLFTTASVKPMPKGMKGKPLSPKEAEHLAKSFWQPDTRKKVDSAISRLFQCLGIAQRVATSQGILSDGSQALRETVGTPTSTSTHPASQGGPRHP